MSEQKTFTELALRTESRPQELSMNPDTVHGLLKMMVKASEVIDTAKRAIFYGKPLDTKKYFSSLAVLSDISATLFEKESGIGNFPLEQFAPVNLRLLHATLGIFGESGELAEALIKQMETEELDLVNVSEELGDIDWYKQIGHDETGVSEVDVRAKIIAKLMKRYPDKFDSEAAHNRDLASERAALENTTA